MFFNKRGVVIITLIIWVIIIGVILLYAPRVYHWYVEQNEIKIIKSNVESVEKEIKSELLDKHPVLIWNDIDNIINSFLLLSIIFTFFYFLIITFKWRTSPRRPIASMVRVLIPSKKTTTSPGLLQPFLV